MQRMNAEDLFVKYQAGRCSPEEQAVVENWLTFGEVTELDLSEAELEQDLNELSARIAGIPVKHRVMWPRIAGVAAAAVAMIVLGVWFFGGGLQRQDGVGNRTGLDELAANDIAPGRNGATITLGNGKVIELSAQKTGVVVGDAVRYSDGSAVGATALTSSDQMAAGGKAQDLTASTGRGQTYQFVLADGTKVWLNADSKISFPNQFNGVERKILLDGEGYFEVAKDKAHPFIVESKGQRVAVLGTHFNINSYADEAAVKTTLVEGSVSVSLLDGRKQSQILKPGQQSVLLADRIRVQDIDAPDMVAWKDGVFIFNDESLQEVMRKIARWYNVEVVYEGVNLDKRFGGSVSRYDNVSKVLKKLEQTGGIHFKIEGRRITAMR